MGLLTGKKNEANDDMAYLTMNPFLYYGISIASYAFVVVMSIFVGDISLVLGIIGATAGSAMVFIFPAAFLLTSHRGGRDFHE